MTYEIVLIQRVSFISHETMNYSTSKEEMLNYFIFIR